MDVSEDRLRLEAAMEIRARMGTPTLLVEDDAAMLYFLGDAFATAGYDTRCAASAADARTALKQQRYDLVVLDIGLPDGSGLDLIPDCRSHPRTGIIILTGSTGQEERLLGLGLGVDDYLTKPFSIEELLLRSRNLLRRLSGDGTVESTSPGNPVGYRFGDWEFDLPRRRLIPTNGEPVALTRNECQLLHALVARAGETLERVELLKAIGHAPEMGNDRAIDWLILKLRRKLNEDARAPLFIFSEYGCGYRFTGHVETI